MKIYLVSACLAGEQCRYDGGANTCPEVQELVRAGLAIPVCPEMLGGLPCPRVPCERRDDKVLAQDGTDCTAAFHRGALAAREIARKHGCRAAILKAKSPSCGAGEIYDGTFSRTLTAGDGLCAALLRAEGLDIFTEKNLPRHLSL